MAFISKVGSDLVLEIRVNCRGDRFILSLLVRIYLSGPELNFEYVSQRHIENTVLSVEIRSLNLLASISVKTARS